MSNFKVHVILLSDDAPWWPSYSSIHVFTVHCIGTMVGCYWLLQFVSMCHLWGESRPLVWLWARWYGDHCLVSTLTLPRHPRVPMGHTADSPRPRVSSVSGLTPHVHTGLYPLSDVSPVKAVKARIDPWHAATPAVEEKNWLAGPFNMLPLLATMLNAVFLFICQLSHTQNIYYL